MSREMHDHAHLQHSPPHLMEEVAEVLAAFVSNNSVQASELPSLVKMVHTALLGVFEGHAVAPPEVPKAPSEPAVPIKKSVTKDFIICLEDGKPFKSLRRHLSTAYQMTPEQYRKKWGLPADYPMVAPAYAAIRSELAKQSGLGVVRGEPRPPRPVDPTEKRKRGRPRKVA